MGDRKPRMLTCSVIKGKESHWGGGGDIGGGWGDGVSAVVKG